MNQGIKAYRKLDEVVYRLEEIASTPEMRISDDPSLTRAIKALVSIDEAILEKGNKEQITWLAERLLKLDATKADAALENLFDQIEAEAEIEAKEADLSGKAVNPELLKQLVEEFDEHQALTEKGFDSELERVLKKGGLESYREQIKKAIAREMEIYRENLRKIESKNPELNAREREELAIKTAEVQAVMEQKLAAEGKSQEEVKRQAEKIAEVVVLEHKDEKREAVFATAARVEEVLKDEKIEPVLRKEIIEDVKDTAAAIAVEKQARTIAKELVEEVKNGNNETVGSLIDKNRTKIEEEVTKRVKEVIDGTKDTIDYREQTIDGRGVPQVGDDFVTKVTKILTLPAEEGEKGQGQIPEIKIESGSLRQIELEIRGYVENQMPTVDRYRGSQLEKKALVEVIANNPTIQTERAVAYAKTVREISYGEEGVSLTPEEKMAAINAEEMYEVDRSKSKRATQEFRIIQKLISSDKPIGQQAAEFEEKFGDLVKSDNNLDEIGATTRIMRLINRNQTVRDVLGGVQRIIKIRGQSPEWLKAAWKKSGLETGAKQITKAGGEWVQKVAGVSAKEFAMQGIGSIAKYGLEDGVIHIGKQLLAKAMKPLVTKAAQSAAGKALIAGGAKLAAALGLSSTGIGAVVVAGAAVLSELWGKIKGTIKAIEKSIDKVLGPEWRKRLAKLNIAAPIVKEIKGWIPGITDKIPDWILTGGMVFFGLMSMIMAMSITAVIGPAVIGTFVGLMAWNILFLNPMVSSLVPPAPPRGVEVWNDPNVAFGENVPLPTRDPSIPISPSCPEIWPTDSGYITQGPNGTWSHRGVQAIDIGVGGVPIKATHGGVARAGTDDHGYGNYVIVDGICNGVHFSTLYAHMPTKPFDGQITVKQGDVIGKVDSTGNSTGNHLHYELRNLGDINKWLPKPVRPTCSSVAQCGTRIP